MTELELGPEIESGPELELGPEPGLGRAPLSVAELSRDKIRERKKGLCLD